MNWDVIVNYRAHFKKKGRNLVVLLNEDSPSRYTAIAVDAPDNAETINDVFSNHAHAVICTNVTKRKAETCVRAFVKKWKATSEEIPPCECETIQAEAAQ